MKRPTENACGTERVSSKNRGPLRPRSATSLLLTAASASRTAVRFAAMAPGSPSSAATERAWMAIVAASYALAACQEGQEP